MKLFLLILFINLSLLSKELITPIPLNIDYDLNKAKLGKKLFFDTRLSRDNTISCASCHLLDSGGSDNLPVSFGVEGAKGKRNTPTVFNSRYNIFQFWDARAKNLEEQAVGPIHNKIEMDTTLEEIISKIKDDEVYKEGFLANYKDGITEKNLIDSIVEFEKALTTPNSRFDKYLRGEKDILTSDEIKGYNLFKEYGCISCHNGINIGGNIIQKIGVFKKYSSSDLGLYEITKKDEDKYFFKVPSLRNVELTAPYFHDGEIDKLKDAVNKMSRIQVGFLLEEEDINNIVKFLKTLTGEKPSILNE